MTSPLSYSDDYNRKRKDLTALDIHSLIKWRNLIKLKIVLAS